VPPAPRSCINQRVFNIQIMAWGRDVSHWRRRLFLFLLQCSIHFDLPWLFMYARLTKAKAFSVWVKGDVTVGVGDPGSCVCVCVWVNGQILKYTSISFTCIHLYLSSLFFIFYILYFIFYSHVFSLLVLLLLRQISPWGLIKYLSIYLSLYLKGMVAREPSAHKACKHVTLPVYQRAHA